MRIIHNQNTEGLNVARTTSPIAGVPAFDHVISRNYYGRYCLPTAFLDREVPKILRTGGIYEPKTLQMIRGLCGTGDIVSGGAFVGDFLPAISEVLAEDAMLHSFEPQPMTFEAASFTIALNGLTNVSLSQVAVADAPGTLPLQIARLNGNPLAAAAKIVDAPIDGQTIDVDVTTLDDLIPEDRAVSVLHLDIEGHELPALLGAKSLISRNAPVIILEAAKPRMRRLYKRALQQHFPEIGYQISETVERNVFFNPTAGQSG